MSTAPSFQDRPGARPATLRPSASAAAAPVFREACGFWTLNREATLNWLAFGLLLAAWNAAGDDASHGAARPEGLRGYSSVSVRAAQRSIAQIP
jgi:hypothetical protein